MVSPNSDGVNNEFLAEADDPAGGTSGAGDAYQPDYSVAGRTLLVRAQYLDDDRANYRDGRNWPECLPKVA
jgi:hypothetical protein